jgi:membrane protein YdbS with pleckstrin-like domain
LWLVLAAASPFAGALTAGPVLALVVLPEIVAYIAIHLRYDTTWYVLSERSLRIRRGIWIINETTITYENVQNLKIDQGPLQRFFGISNVVVETAGGGGGAHGQHGESLSAGHHGLIEGVAEAREIRDLILSQLRRSTTGGLGDEQHQEPAESPGVGISAEQLAVLREIRELTRRLASA